MKGRDVRHFKETCRAVFEPAQTARPHVVLRPRGTDPPRTLALIKDGRAPAAAVAPAAGWVDILSGSCRRNSFCCWPP